MLNGYKTQPSGWILDEIIKESNSVEVPADSRLLFELRELLLKRLINNLIKPSEAKRLIINRLTGKPGISQQRVQKLCEVGRLGQRVGGGWVISLEEIEAYNRKEVKDGW